MSIDVEPRAGAGLQQAEFPDSRLTRRSLLKFAAASVGVAAFGPLLAACGDDDDDDDDSGGTSPTSSTGAGTSGTTPTSGASTGTGTGTTATGGTGGGQTHMVDMTTDNTFDPAEMTIKVGDTVTWTVVGASAHSSTCDPSKAADPAHAVLPEGAEPWDSGILTEGQDFSHTFDVAGDYTYFCMPHESLGMIGTLTVEE
jgi:plastocyanin